MGAACDPYGATGGPRRPLAGHKQDAPGLALDLAGSRRVSSTKKSTSDASTGNGTQHLGTLTIDDDLVC